MITPNIPAISNKATPTEVKQAIDQIRAFFAVVRQQGGFLSVAEAIDGTYPIAANDPGTDGENIDTTIPAAITGLVVTGAFNSIFLEWDIPSYSNHAYTEIHRAEVDDLGLAVFIGTTQAYVYADVPPESSLSQVYYYWVRNVSTSGIVGPFNQTSGTPGSTASDPAYVRDLMLSQLGYEDGIFPVRAEDELPVLPDALYPVDCAVFLRPDGPLYWNVDNEWVAKIEAALITGQLTDDQLAEIAAAKISGQLTNDQLAAIASTKITGQLTDDQLAEIAAAKISGQLTTTQISDSAISTPKLAVGAVSANSIAAGAITADKIAANSITAAKIATGAITASKLAAGSVIAGKIAALSITATEIAAGAISAAKIAAGTITADKIAANSITAAKIATGAITASKLAAGSVIAGKIATGAIVAGDGVIGNLAITNAHIANATITSAKIASLAADKITTGYIAAARIAAGSLTANKIVSNSLTATQIAANAIGVSELAANSVTAVKIAAGQVTAGKVATNAITTETINGHAVSDQSGISWAGSIRLCNAVWTNITGVSVSAIAGGIIYLHPFDVSITGGGGDGYGEDPATWRIYCTTTGAALPKRDNLYTAPSSGTYTFYIQGYYSQYCAHDSGYMKTATLFALSFKR